MALAVTGGPTDSGFVPQEVRRILEPFTRPRVDASDPRFIVRVNMQQLHTQALNDAVSKTGSRHKSVLNEVPHDRERARLRMGPSAATLGPVTALGVAASATDLVCMARGTVLTEWRDHSEKKDVDLSDESDAGSAGPALGEEGGLYRRWESEVEVTSVVAINAHYMPLWAGGSPDGTVRVWGRGDAAPLVACWTIGSAAAAVDPASGTRQALWLGWDAPAARLYAGSAGSTTVEMWDATQQMHAGSFEVPAQVTSIGVGPASNLCLAGMRTGQVALLDSRTQAPVQIWNELSTQIVGTSMCVGGDWAWTQMVAGAVDGRVLFWDLRAPAHSSRSLTVPLGKSSQARALCAHPLFGEIVCGTSEGVAVFCSKGTPLSSIKFFESGQPVGGVEKVCIHPLAPVICAGLQNGEGLVLSTQY